MADKVSLSPMTISQVATVSFSLTIGTTPNFNNSENVYHGLYFNEDFDEALYDNDIILSRKSHNLQDQYGEENPKSRISEFQANLICYAYTELGYSMKDCAIYAWMEGDSTDVALVSSIINGYAWKSVSINYGILPKEKRKSIKRATPIRPEKLDEYNEIRNKKRR